MSIGSSKKKPLIILEIYKPIHMHKVVHMPRTVLRGCKVHISGWPQGSRQVQSEG